MKRSACFMRAYLRPVTSYDAAQDDIRLIRVRQALITVTRLWHRVYQAD